MDKALAKNLERIRRMADKGQFEKALAACDEVQADRSGSLELSREKLRSLLFVSPWSQILHQLKQMLARHDLHDLLTEDARPQLIHTFIDNAPFRGALLDFLLNIQAYEQIAFIMDQLDPPQRQRLVQSWENLASEIQDQGVATSWLVAAGLGHFAEEHVETAWERWTTALQRDPRYLKKLMAICNRSDHFDLTDLRNRLRLIRLIVAAGKHEESLSLLQALGMESRECALQVLIEAPDILSKRIQDCDVCQLRFNLACQLGDQELMANVIADMGMLVADDLFAFQKQALVNLEDRVFKRFVLMQIAELYIKKGNWEPAALLLESLHQEDEHPEVVALMEYVLENYPILPRLHLTVAAYQVKRGFKEQALKHLSLIKGVGEFTAAIRNLLEDTLAKEFDRDYADFLFDVLPHESQAAALITIALVLDVETVEEEFYERVLAKAPQREPDPFWLLALISVSHKSGKRDDAVARLTEFLESFPELSAEVVKIAEQLTEIPGHLQPLAKVVAEKMEFLQPRDLWVIVRKQCEQAYPAVETKPVEGSGDRDATVTDPELKVEKSPFSRGLNEVTAFVSEGEHLAAAQMAERLAEKYPDRFRIVIACIDRFQDDPKHRLLWDKARFNILIRAEAYDEAATFGRTMLRGPIPQDQLASIQQLVAYACQGQGDYAEALKFFCLSSKQARFFKANRDHLLGLVFPDQLASLPEVLSVVLAHGDIATLQRLMNAWKAHVGKATDEMMQWHLRFAQHTKDPKALIGVARWAVEQGRSKDAQSVLVQLDLKQQGLVDDLTELAEVTKRELEGDYTAGFILGRYFLVHGDSAKAVSAFRDLISHAPKSARRVYDYLKKYLGVHPEHGGNVRLYGLLIRVGLDLGLLKDSVHALASLGESDLAAARSLTDGITRVILDRPHQAEALSELIGVLADWGDYERVIDVCMQGEFGRVGVKERIQQLQSAAQSDALVDRANLALARLYHGIQEFDRCRAALGLIQDEDVRGKALDIYAKMVARFPKDSGLAREAAWAAWLNGRYDEAVRYFSALADSSDSPAAVEAFAILSEREVPVSFEELLSKTGLARNDGLGQLRQVYARLRDMDLLRWEKQGGPIPYDALEWLLSTGQLKRFHHLFEKMRAFLDKNWEDRLQALYLRTHGRPYYGAMRMAQGDQSVGTKRSMLAECGFLEQAVMIKDPDQATPLWLKQRFLQQYGAPKWLTAQTHLLRGAAEFFRSKNQMRQLAEKTTGETS